MNIQEIQHLRSSLRVLEREIEKQMESETSYCGVSLAQCYALLEIEKQEGFTLKELSDSLELDKSTLSRTIDGLVQSGHVIRAGHPSDRRFVRLRLTDKGREVCEHIHKVCNDYYNNLLSEIPTEARRSIVEGVPVMADTMRKIRKNGEINTLNG